LDPPLRVAPLRCRRFPQPTASLAEMWCWGFAQPIPEAISNQIKTEETSDKITSNMKLYRLVEI